MARRVYMRGGAGVGAFKKVFGGRKSRGTRPELSAKGSGSIARHILKQLEVLKILEKVPEGKGCARSLDASRALCEHALSVHSPSCLAGVASLRRASVILIRLPASAQLNSTRAQCNCGCGQGGMCPSLTTGSLADWIKQGGPVG